MPNNTTQQTIDLMKNARSKPDEIIKAFVQPGTATEGLQAYNLEAPAKKIIPIYTPFRNKTPRVTGGFNIQANWKAITGINVKNVRPGVSEGNRGGAIQHATKEYFAAFRGYGLEDYVTFEAQYAGQTYEDAKALAVTGLLESFMISEERLMIGGNGSVLLGTTPTPVLAVATGGELADATTYRIICVALGMQAYLDVVGVNNGATGEYFDAATAVVPGKITRKNTDGTEDVFGGGSAKVSAAATILTTAANQQIVATVTPVIGAVGYAWYIGTASGNERLVAVSAINSVIISSVAESTAQLASDLGTDDNSTSHLDFDGYLYQIFKEGSNAYVKVMPNGTAGTGTPLTADGAGGIEEFTEAFFHFWNRYRLSPSKIWCSAEQLADISTKVIKNAGAPLLRQMIGPDFEGKIDAGVMVGRVLNKATGVYVPIEVHPNMPSGTIMFETDKLPYKLSNVSNIARMLMRTDYYQLEWPIKSRKWEYGVYADGVLQHYAPFALGVLTNIGRTA